MRMYDIIHKKRDGGALSREELEYFIGGVTDGSIPDYQITALLMAIFLRGMTDAETAALTLLMADSGDRVDLSALEGFKVDKHSTGGVGDKTTLIVAPVVAACGVLVAKMSGRGLGHTGGTVDKLESIPGFQTSLSTERFFEVVREAGLAVVGQSGNLAPADKKLYALRDVTATIESLPLIAASIMSKKLAAGADGIVLDVKSGSGAFMKTVDDAVGLARAMVSIGERTGRRTVALITDMDRPLGAAVGNSLEVTEAVETLKGGGPADLREVSLELAANMLFLAQKGDIGHCRALAKESLQSGRALARLTAMVTAQGGDPSVLADPSKFVRAAHTLPVTALKAGYVTAMDTERIGMASVVLGAGRETKDSPIDTAAGILLRVKPGQWVERGEALATLLTDREPTLAEAGRMLLEAVTLGDAPPAPMALIHARVHAGGVERF